MTTTVSAKPRTALRRAAVRATLAPSVHNTQPWSLRLTKEGGLDIFADRARQLAVLDPTSRQLTISCGCALLNARVSLAGDGIGVHGPAYGRRSGEPARHRRAGRTNRSTRRWPRSTT